MQQVLLFALVLLGDWIALGLSGEEEYNARPVTILTARVSHAVISAVINVQSPGDSLQKRASAAQ